MPKDKAYGKKYNQKRKEYLVHKKREARAKLKMSTTIPLSTTKPLKVVDNSPEVVDRSKVVDLEKVAVVDTKLNQVVDKVVDQPPMSTTASLPENKMSTTKSRLWSDYYSVKKPGCYPCQQKGIKETAHAFCSREKIKDALSIRLPNRYACNVYHGTLYQGQGKVKGANHA